MSTLIKEKKNAPLVLGLMSTQQPVMRTNSTGTNHRCPVEMHRAARFLLPTHQFKLVSADKYQYTPSASEPCAHTAAIQTCN